MSAWCKKWAAAHLCNNSRVSSRAGLGGDAVGGISSETWAAALESARERICTDESLQHTCAAVVGVMRASMALHDCVREPHVTHTLEQETGAVPRLP